MKKIVAILVALALCLSVACAADITWADVEPYVEQLGLTGQFYQLNALPVLMWVPDTMVQVELDQEYVDEGYIVYFVTEDESASLVVTYVDVNGASLEEYAEYLKSIEITDVELGTVNGLPCVTYTMLNEEGNKVGAITFATEQGNMLEITSDGDLELFALTAASIQAAE